MGHEGLPISGPISVDQRQPGSKRAVADGGVVEVDGLEPDIRHRADVVGGREALGLQSGHSGLPSG